MSSRGNSPLVGPAMPVPVPLITPRYQKKTRTHNQITVVPAAPSESTQSPTVDSPTQSSDSASSAKASVSQLLKQRSTDALHIKHGDARYNEQVQFHTYELYRHGKHEIHSKSIGYSSDGDLVLVREDYALVSDSDLEVQKQGTVIGSAVCLNPKARRPLTDEEAALKPKKLKAPRFRKYPGIKCPRNKKVRNRLMNDHFANEYARKIYEATCNDSVDEEAVSPTFPALSKEIALAVVHIDEDKERRELERRGIYLSTPPLHPASTDPNSGDVRFQQLNNKLKEELKNALGSEFLTQQIIDLEAYFVDYIKNPPADDAPMVFQFRDGYGRLVCHGVAAFYNLVSKSREGGPDEKRQTTVARPKRTEVQLPNCSLLSVLQRKQGRSPVMAGAPSPLMPPFHLDDPLLVYSEKHVDAALAQAKSEITSTQKKKLRKTMRTQMETHRSR